MTDNSKKRVRVWQDEWNDALGFAQAMQVRDQLWIAGQVSVNGDGTPVGIGDAHTQAEQVWGNLAAVLTAAGGSMDDLVATTTYIVDRAYREVVTEARMRWLEGTTYPTNTLVIVNGLGEPEYLMEISAVARLGSSA